MKLKKNEIFIYETKLPPKKKHEEKSRIELFVEKKK